MTGVPLTRRAGWNVTDQAFGALALGDGTLPAEAWPTAETSRVSRPTRRHLDRTPMVGRFRGKLETSVALSAEKFEAI